MPDWPRVLDAAVALGRSFVPEQASLALELAQALAASSPDADPDHDLRRIAIDFGLDLRTGQTHLEHAGRFEQDDLRNHELLAARAAFTAATSKRELVADPVRLAYAYLCLAFTCLIQGERAAAAADVVEATQCLADYATALGVVGNARFQREIDLRRHPLSGMKLRLLFVGMAMGASIARRVPSLGADDFVAELEEFGPAPVRAMRRQVRLQREFLAGDESRELVERLPTHLRERGDLATTDDDVQVHQQVSGLAIAMLYALDPDAEVSLQCASCGRRARRAVFAPAVECARCRDGSEWQLPVDLSVEGSLPDDFGDRLVELAAAPFRKA